MVAKIHTRLCVSGEQGHSQFLLAHYIVLVSIEDKVI